MKRNLFSLTILIIISILFISCSKANIFSKEEAPYHHGILKEINDTITDNPAEALSMLNNISDTTRNNFSEQEYYEYHILLEEAHYKNFQLQENYNIIAKACNYFDSLTLIYPQNTDVLFLSSKALYYNAVGYEEKEENKNAFKKYLESLKRIEDINLHFCSKSKTDEIQHFKALIYTRLGEILYWHDVNDPAIECFKNANDLFALENNQNALSRNNFIIAVIYGLNFNHDKALHHLAIADSILNDGKTKNMLKNDIERIKASVLYNTGNKEEAFRSIINQYKTLDNQEQKMEAAGVLGDMYYDQKIYDSAIYYYEKYFPSNKFSKINAANNIIEISIITGDNELITKYAPSLAEETNKEILLSSIKTELTSLYHKYEEEKNDDHLYNKILNYLFLVFATTILLFFIGLKVINHKREKYENEISEKKNYINSLEKKIRLRNK